MTDKDIQDIRSDELSKKGRNQIEDYWKVKPISVEEGIQNQYKSSDNIKGIYLSFSISDLFLI